MAPPDPLTLTKSIAPSMRTPRTIERYSHILGFSALSPSSFYSSDSIPSTPGLACPEHTPETATDRTSRRVSFSQRQSPPRSRTPTHSTGSNPGRSSQSGAARRSLSNSPPPRRSRRQPPSHSRRHRRPSAPAPTSRHAGREAGDALSQQLLDLRDVVDDDCDELHARLQTLDDRLDEVRGGTRRELQSVAHDVQQLRREQQELGAASQQHRLVLSEVAHRVQGSFACIEDTKALGEQGVATMLELAAEQAATKDSVAEQHARLGALETEQAACLRAFQQHVDVVDRAAGLETRLRGVEAALSSRHPGSDAPEEATAVQLRAEVSALRGASQEELAGLRREVSAVLQAAEGQGAVAEATSTELAALAARLLPDMEQLAQAQAGLRRDTDSCARAVELVAVREDVSGLASGHVALQAAVDVLQASQAAAAASRSELAAEVAERAGAGELQQAVGSIAEMRGTLRDGLNDARAACAAEVENVKASVDGCRTAYETDLQAVSTRLEEVHQAVLAEREARRGWDGRLAECESMSREGCHTGTLRTGRLLVLEGEQQDTATRVARMEEGLQALQRQVAALLEEGRAGAPPSADIEASTASAAVILQRLDDLEANAAASKSQSAQEVGALKRETAELRCEVCVLQGGAAALNARIAALEEAGWREEIAELADQTAALAAQSARAAGEQDSLADQLAEVEQAMTSGVQALEARCTGLDAAVFGGEAAPSESGTAALDESARMREELSQMQSELGGVRHTLWTEVGKLQCDVSQLRIVAASGRSTPSLSPSEPRGAFSFFGESGAAASPSQLLGGAVAQPAGPQPDPTLSEPCSPCSQAVSFDWDEAPQLCSAESPQSASPGPSDASYPQPEPCEEVCLSPPTAGRTAGSPRVAGEAWMRLFGDGASSSDGECGSEEVMREQRLSPGRISMGSLEAGQLIDLNGGNNGCGLLLLDSPAGSEAGSGAGPPFLMSPTRSPLSPQQVGRQPWGGAAPTTTAAWVDETLQRAEGASGRGSSRGASPSRLANSSVSSLSLVGSSREGGSTSERRNSPSSDCSRLSEGAGQENATPSWFNHPDRRGGGAPAAPETHHGRLSPDAAKALAVHSNQLYNSVALSESGTEAEDGAAAGCGSATQEPGGGDGLQAWVLRAEAAVSCLQASCKGTGWAAAQDALSGRLEALEAAAEAWPGVVASLDSRVTAGEDATAACCAVYDAVEAQLRDLEEQHCAASRGVEAHEASLQQLREGAEGVERELGRLRTGLRAAAAEPGRASLEAVVGGVQQELSQLHTAVTACSEEHAAMLKQQAEMRTGLRELEAEACQALTATCAAQTENLTKHLSRQDAIIMRADAGTAEKLHKVEQGLLLRIDSLHSGTQAACAELRTQLESALEQHAQADVSGQLRQVDERTLQQAAGMDALRQQLESALEQHAQADVSGQLKQVDDRTHEQAERIEAIAVSLAGTSQGMDQWKVDRMAAETTSVESVQRLEAAVSRIASFDCKNAVARVELDLQYVDQRVDSLEAAVQALDMRITYKRTPKKPGDTLSLIELRSEYNELAIKSPSPRSFPISSLPDQAVSEPPSPSAGDSTPLASSHPAVETPISPQRSIATDGVVPVALGAQVLELSRLLSDLHWRVASAATSANAISWSGTCSLASLMDLAVPIAELQADVTALQTTEAEDGGARRGSERHSISERIHSLTETMREIESEIASTTSQATLTAT